MSTTRICSVAAAIAFALALPASGAAEIVYTHGNAYPPTSGTWVPSSLWAMNDDGSGPHQLLTPAQVASNQQSICCASLQPQSTTMAFQGLDFQYAGTAAGGFGIFFEGAYTYSNGSSLRLSPAPASGPGAQSSDSPVGLTADGRVVYMRTTCANVLTNPTCSQTQDVVSDNGGNSSSWAWAGGVLGAPPNDFAGDPADGGLLAYSNYLSTSEGGNNFGALILGNQSGSSETLVDGTSNALGLDWSPDASEITFVTDAPTTQPDPAGIYLIAPSVHATPRELLLDPNVGTGQFGNPPTFGAPVFAGQNEIVFSADNNLWEIPTTCNMCTFPAGAHQLTTDGTSTAPDWDPAWTAATISPPVPFKITVSVAGGQKVIKDKGIFATVECNRLCGYGVVAGAAIKGSRKFIYSKDEKGTLAANTPDKIKLPFSAKQLKTIRKALAKHKRVTAEVAANAVDAANTKTDATTTFTVKH